MTNEQPNPAAGWHHYRAFGLCLRSRLVLPELGGETGDERWEAEIEFGEVPLELPDATASGVRYQAAPDRLLLRVDGVARYLVSDGRRITVTREPEGDDDSVRTFLLAQAFGALLHQRDDLVLHGGAIAVDGEAVAFLGPSGVGKSTTTAAFRKRGYPVLTDDLCVVREGPDGRMTIHPGMPQMKLWLDSLEKLDLSPDGLRRLRHKIQKRVLPLGPEFVDRALPIRKIYVLFPSPTDHIELSEVVGPRKFLVLKAQTYRFGYLASIDDKAGHFQLAVKLAQQVRLILAARSGDTFRLDEFVAMIEADLRT